MPYGRSLRWLLETITIKPKQEIIDSLQIDFDEDYLVENRTELFKLSTYRLKEDLANSQGVINGSIVLKCVKRQGPKAHQTNAKDIYELFTYAAGLSDRFPKEVVSKNSDLIDLHKDDSLMEDIEILSVEQKVTLLQSKVGRQENIISDLYKQVGDQKRFLDLERSRISGLEKKIEAILSSGKSLFRSPAESILKQSIEVIPDSQPTPVEGENNNLNVNDSPVVLDINNSINDQLVSMDQGQTGYYSCYTGY
jgi:uncharacterized coiled-coil protein SlyX